MSRQQHAGKKRKSDGGNRGGPTDPKRRNQWKNSPNQQKKDGPGYGKEYLEETEYYLENGLRKVIPYHFTFSSFVKERWFGRTILEVFSEEFRYMTKEEYRRVLDAGQVMVNGRQIRHNFVLAHGDVIEHTIHRHENPVTSAKLEVIENNDDVLVVNKPSSIPVHPCGHYRHNSLVFIIGKDLAEYNLRTIYRLDRLTSGVIVFGKSQKRSLELETHVRERKVEKVYLARVEGEFPTGILECSKPLDILSHKLGLHKVADSGKECHTTFERISYNGKTSVVKCMPATGRTHQIRVHLQYLGFPIINDPLYNSDVWGKDKGKAGNYHKTIDQLIKDISKMHNRDIFDMDLRGEVSLDERGPIQAPDGEAEKKDDKDTVKEEKGDGDQKEVDDKKEAAAETKTNGEASTTEDGADGDTIKFTYDPDNVQSMGPLNKRQILKKLEECPDPMCRDCKRNYRDPRPDEMVMYLHATNYKGPDWEFSSPEPDWAAEDWVDPSGVAS